MNNSDINDAKWMTLRQQIGYMCKSKFLSFYPLRSDLGHPQMRIKTHHREVSTDKPETISRPVRHRDNSLDFNRVQATDPGYDADRTASTTESAGQGDGAKQTAA